MLDEYRLKLRNRKTKRSKCQTKLQEYESIKSKRMRNPIQNTNRAQNISNKNNDEKHRIKIASKALQMNGFRNNIRRLIAT